MSAPSSLVLWQKLTGLYTLDSHWSHHPVKGFLGSLRALRSKLANQGPFPGVVHPQGLEA